MKKAWKTLPERRRPIRETLKKGAVFEKRHHDVFSYRVLTTMKRIRYGVNGREEPFLYWGGERWYLYGFEQAKGRLAEVLDTAKEYSHRPGGIGVRFGADGYGQLVEFYVSKEEK